MPRWMGVSAALSVVLLLAPSLARADRWSLHGTGTGVAGYTDNVEAEPNGNGDLFYEVAPGVLFTYESPRTIHELTYEFRYIGYLDATEANSYSNRWAWRGFFNTGPRTELTLDAALRSGETNTFRPTDGSVAVDFIPAGSDYVAVDASEILRYTLSRNWRLTQGATFNRLDALAGDIDTETTNFGGLIGGDRSWKRDGLGMSLGVNYITLGQADVTNTQINTSLEAAWRRDLSLHWSTVAAAGVTSIFPILDDDTAPERSAVHSPTVSGTLAYFPNWGSMRLVVQRMVAASMFIAQNTIADQALLTAWLPVPYFVEDPLAPVLTVSAGAGYRRSQLVDLTSDDRELANSYALDLGLHYSPQRSEFGVALRYSFFHQDADPSAAAPRFETFTRNAIMLELHVRWPEERAATYPHRDPLRVDGSDMTPLDGDAESDGGAGAAPPGIN